MLIASTSTAFLQYMAAQNSGWAQFKRQFKRVGAIQKGNSKGG
jgi:hypothetical protein